MGRGQKLKSKTHGHACQKAMQAGVDFVGNYNNNNNINNLLKQDYKIQLTNNKTQTAWLTCWLVVG